MVFVTIDFHAGLGKHDKDLQLPDDLVTILKWGWIASLTGEMLAIVARISITI